MRVAGAVVTLIVLVAVAFAHTEKLLPVINKDFVSHVNDIADGAWTAGMNEGSTVHGVSFDEAQKLCGVLPGGPILPAKTHPIKALVDLPDRFNSIENWPQCTSIGTIRDQSACGSCWAFSSSEVMSDRSCIVLEKNISLSAGNLAFCCGSCGFGCNGGWPSAAFTYWVKTGLVEEDCYPYPYPSCDHHIENSTNPCPSKMPEESCPKDTCTNPNWNGPAWKEDLHHGASSYSVSGEANIMAEIIKNGPVSAAFTVYEDFVTYKSGVYRHVTGKSVGGHAVKIVGWDVTEDGTKYWIIANSWNRNWGNNGFFWMLKGKNECGIESQCVAGIPKD